MGQVDKLACPCKTGPQDSFHMMYECEYMYGDINKLMMDFGIQIKGMKEYCAWWRGLTRNGKIDGIMTMEKMTRTTAIDKYRGTMTWTFKRLARILNTTERILQEKNGLGANEEQ